MTLDEVEKKTRIRKKFLQAIERNDWRIFSSKTYIIGVIKSYGKFLNLDEEKLIAFFRRVYERKEKVKFKKKAPPSYFIPKGKKIFKGSVFLISLLFFLYFAYQLKIYFSPPKVTILRPKQTVFKRKNKIKLVGKVEKDAIVKVNGEEVFPNKENIFEIDIPLVKKKNEVVIEVIGANGKKTVIKKVFEKTPSF